MKYIQLAVFVFGLNFVFSGCAHTEKIRAVTSDASRPSEGLGTLEVFVKTNPWSPSNWGVFFKELFSLTFADTSYEARLKTRLVKKAAQFSADEVVKVQFWPDLNSSKFPNGKVYARGEMVRYTRFPKQA